VEEPGMEDLLEEMLYCEFMLVCETHDCRNFFEFEEVAREPMEDWARRAAVEARRCGWAIGHTGLVKCPACGPTPRRTIEPNKENV
jgi:hypothetical protein